MRHSTSSLDDEDDNINNNIGSSSTNANTATTSWVRHKERGKILYERGDYENALQSYRSALSSSSSSDDSNSFNNNNNNNFGGGGPNQQEKQLLLSNVVACRLKIGGRSQAEAAVQDAKRCVAINQRWAKGHVRLASAFIALGEHSNEACNSLQTALRYDPGNSVARQMLVRELRRDHAAAAAAAAASSSSRTASQQSYDDADEQQDEQQQQQQQQPPSQNPNYVPPSPPNDATTFHDDNNNNNNNNNNNIDIDDTVSFNDRMTFYYERTREMYASQSELTQTVIKIGLVLIVLYVAFGGRFGFEYVMHQQGAGNYGQGNAYDQYNSNQQRRASSSSSYNSYDSYDSYDDPYGGRRRSRSSSYSGGGGYGGGGGGGSMFDGNFQYMALVAGGMFLCHRLGMNPWHAMLMLNMANGGRRFGGGRRMYRGGYGGGGGGFGYGGMRYGRPRRGRGW